jgi:hypothetical protein
MVYIEWLMIGMNLKDIFRKAEFSFTLTESYSETSKDSHRYSKSYSLDGKVLRFLHTHSGFPDDKEEAKEVRANNSMVSAIKDKIMGLGLYTNYEKKFPVNERGTIMRTTMKLVIQDGEEKYAISVSGGSRGEIKDEFDQKLGVFYSFIAGIFQR